MITLTKTETIYLNSIEELQGYIDLIAGTDELTIEAGVSLKNQGCVAVAKTVANRPATEVWAVSPEIRSFRLSSD